MEQFFASETFGGMGGINSSGYFNGTIVDENYFLAL